jgi:hypothetical protein
VKSGRLVWCLLRAGFDFRTNVQENSIAYDRRIGKVVFLLGERLFWGAALYQKYSIDALVVLPIIELSKLQTIE